MLFLVDTYWENKKKIEQEVQSNKCSNIYKEENQIDSVNDKTHSL